MHEERSHSDELILKLILDDHDDEGFKMLVSNYQESLYCHIRRMVHLHEDANDVLQNTFIKVYKNIYGFKRESKLFTWMYRIATNESINFLNKKKKHKKNDSEESLQILENSLKADQYFDPNEINIELQKAISTLPDKQKSVFTMRYYDDLTYQEMSQILETSVGALKASYHHAVKKIESYLKERVNYVG